MLHHKRLVLRLRLISSKRRYKCALPVTAESIPTRPTPRSRQSSSRGKHTAPEHQTATLKVARSTGPVVDVALAFNVALSYPVEAVIPGGANCLAWHEIDNETLRKSGSGRSRLRRQ
jgi:hypothetical protein